MDDIFISISLKDVDTYAGTDTNWLKEFRQHLSIMLGTYLNREPRISDSTANAIPTNAKIFIVIGSGKYLDGTASRELTAFRDATKDLVQKKSRIFIAHKDQEERLCNEFPFLSECDSVELFAIKKNNFLHEFSPDPSFGEHSDLVNFRLTTDLLARKAAEVIRTLEKDSIAPCIEVQDARPKVFVGYSTDETRSYMLKLDLELEKQFQLVHGDTVLGPNFEEMTLGLLQRCVVSIHPIGFAEAPIPKGKKSFCSDIEMHLAKTRAKSSSLSRIIWLPNTISESVDDFELELERKVSVGQISHLHSTFLREILRAKDLLVSDYSELKTAIKKILVPPQIVKPISTAECHSKVYMLYEKIDQKLAQELHKDLQKKNYQILSPSFGGSDVSRRRVHVDNLQKCDEVRMLWGRSCEQWVWANLADIRRSNFHRRQNLRRTQLVLSPFTAEKHRVADHFPDLRLEIEKYGA